MATTVKLTAAQRKETRVRAAEAAEVARAASWAAFETERPAHWLKLWARALQLELTVLTHPELGRSFRRDKWWFRDFSVDPVNETFTSPETGSAVSQDSLHPSGLQRIGADLEQGFVEVADYLAALEREALEAAERQRQRQLALGKLTDADKKALGLT